MNRFKVKKVMAGVIDNVGLTQADPNETSFSNLYDYGLYQSGSVNADFTNGDLLTNTEKSALATSWYTALETAASAAWQQLQVLQQSIQQAAIFIIFHQKLGLIQQQKLLFHLQLEEKIWLFYQKTVSQLKSQVGMKFQHQIPQLLLIHI
jgi:hypothetical protein